MKLWAALSLLLVLACQNDPTYESGKLENRPQPTTMEEEAAQQAEKQARLKALEEKGLCTPEAIRAAPHPDERFWHCQGQDWVESYGKTAIADTLEALRADPQLYEDFCARNAKKVREKLPRDGLFFHQTVICEGTPAGDAAKQRPPVYFDPVGDFLEKKRKEKGKQEKLESERKREQEQKDIAKKKDSEKKRKSEAKKREKGEKRLKKTLERSKRRALREKKTREFFHNIFVKKKKFASYRP